MTRTYIKKDSIKAEQFDGSFDMQAKYAMMSVHFTSGKSATSMPVQNGDVKVNVGDWIATGINGEHWTITDEAFQQAYAELPAIPKFVADWIENCRQLDSGDIATVLLSNDDEQPQGKFADYTTTYVIYNANTVARAYLDGYQVEGD